jgi:arginyl-tRNA synthetase
MSQKPVVEPATPRRAVRTALQRAVDGYLSEQGADGVSVEVQRPARPEHGDFASNVAMQLAKQLGRPPMELAQEIAAKVEIGGPVGAVEVAPPGFINVRLDEGWVFDDLRPVVAAGEDWGRTSLGQGQSVQVEYVSANPTGPLLLSTGRGAVVGDTLVRLLGFTGHSTVSEFYVNDAGRQVQLFGASILAVRLGESPPEDGYQGEYISEYAAASAEALPDDDLQRLLAGDKRDEAVALVSDWAVKRVLAEVDRDLAAIGVQMDVWRRESELYGSYEDEVVDALRAAGHVVEHDGATWLRFPDGKEDVLYKTNGERTYFLGDMVYHHYKFKPGKTGGFERVIDVWGADHQNQLRRMKQAMEMIGVDPDRLRIVIIQLVRMKGDEGFIKISKRAGNVVLLRDLVDEVGADAVRYHYLLRSTDAPMDFDIDLARRQSNENPVFYAQMAHARLCSVKAVAAEAGFAPSDHALGRLGAAGEVELARTLLEFPDVVDEAAANLEPHHLPHYAQRLAERIHTFYHAGSKDASLRVVGDDAELAGARLYLCEAARQTMANLLGLMGVSAPTRM